MNIRTLCIAMGISVVTTAAVAAEKKCPMTYAEFEIAVPHIDLEECPKKLKADGVFCRVSAGGDFLHVFAFSEERVDPEQCLRDVETYDEDAFSVTVK